jgi:hypothetical protein
LAGIDSAIKKTDCSAYLEVFLLSPIIFSFFFLSLPAASFPKRQDKQLPGSPCPACSSLLSSPPGTPFPIFLSSFQSLLEATPKEHADYERLSTLTQKTVMFCKKINDSQKITDEKKIQLEVLNEVLTPKIDVVSKIYSIFFQGFKSLLHHIIFQENVSVLKHTATSWKEKILVCLSDMAMIGEYEKRSTKSVFKLSTILNFSTLIIRDVGMTTNSVPF